MLQCFRLYIAYNGSAFSGFQTQKACRTVQGELESALFSLTGQSLSVRVAGRTDAGVHAEGQIVSLSMDTNFDARKLMLALSAKLPHDISVWRIDTMPLAFDARQHSVGKRYVYRIWQGLVPNLHLRHRAWHIASALDLAAMREAACYLIGDHDFSSFRSAQCQATHAQRYLWHIALSERGQLLEIDIRGNAFCLNMVRIIVGTLVDVGRGKLPAHDLKSILLAKDRTKAGITAKPHGLSLEQVYYPDDLAEALIPKGALFPRFPVTASSWPF